MKINKFEELSINAWPALQIKFYDGWVLRFADGYTKRSNSINPIYESTIELDKKIDYCERLYSTCNLPTVFKLTAESCPKGIDSRLVERGYIKVDETSVRVLDLSQFTYQEPKNVVKQTILSDTWMEGYYRCSKLVETKSQMIASKILGNIIGEVIYVTKELDGEIIGCGLGVIERGYVGIYDIVVEKNYRGNGFGQDIVEGILSEAFKYGVETAYLQVVVGNTPAECLYEKLGFSEIYRYWYRKQE